MTHQGRSDGRADLRPIQREDWNERWQRQVAAEANRSNQAPSPGMEAEEAGDPILQLAEALKPFGFRWPGPQPATAPARGPSAESLFLKAGQSAAAYRHWRANTRINLRLSRLFLLMRQGWSNEAIEEAISETALASWWLSGKSTDWCMDPVHHKVTRSFVTFLKTPAEAIEAEWRARQQQATPKPYPKPAAPSTAASPKVLSSSEVVAQLPEHSINAFRKQLVRAAHKFKDSGQKAPVPLGGAGKGWALVRLGKGGHGGGHLLQRLSANP